MGKGGLRLAGNYPPFLEAVTEFFLDGRGVIPMRSFVGAWIGGLVLQLG